jgi:O-antigen/teichoic acid export membrane protein
VLTSGTVLSQLISLFLSTRVTREFLPEETADLGLFLRIVGVGAALATLRYEMALPIPKNDTHSFRLYRLAFFVTLIITAVSFVILGISSIFVSDWEMALFLLLIPVGLFFTSVLNIGTNWAIRFKKFSEISYTNVTNSTFSGGLKWLFGVMNTGSIGLIVATILGLFISSFWYLREFFRSRKLFNVRMRSKRNYAMALQYSEYPKINLPHVLMDLGRDLLVATIILQLYSKTDFGSFDHSYRMLRLPLILVGMSIGQVFFQRVAERVNNKLVVLPDIRKSILMLSLLSIVPFGVIFFFGDDLFAYVFSEAWRQSGEFAEILTPWFMVNFIVSPLTSLPLVLGKQREFFYIAIFGSTMILLAISLPYYLYDASMETTLWILSISQVFYRIFLIFKIFGFASKADQKLA